MCSRNIKSDISKMVSKIIGIKKEIIEELLEWPPQNIDADISLPCFALSNALSKSPSEAAAKIVSEIKPSKNIRNALNVGPYVNFYLNWKTIGNTLLMKVMEKSENYGSSDIGKGKTVLIDFSSPNIAKPMTIAHLRSTIIGHSLYRIFSFLGYRCIGDNHLGDWGTQYGKLVYAYKKWGSEKELRKNPIKHLLELYVKFHKEAEKNPEIENMGRKEFRKLESGDRKSLSLWKKFRKLSIQEFNKTYKRLDVSFDMFMGESEYVELSREIVSRALLNGVARKSEGAVIIEFGDELPPLIIQKSDESTLYQTRDIAALEYRMKKFNPERILYVVGSEQKLYFKQVFRAAEMSGIEHTGQHIPFGMISLPEGKMSTRKGRVVFLDDVLDKAESLAERIIKEKNPSLKERKEVASMIGIGAVKYKSLARDRIKDVLFDWNEMLSFDGNTGPYLQYTYARASSILRKSGIKEKDMRLFDAGILANKKERLLLRKILMFGETIENAARDYNPHYIAAYAYELAGLFNEFYESLPVLKAKDTERVSRLALTHAVRNVLRNAMFLLGMKCPERM